MIYHTLYKYQNYGNLALNFPRDRATSLLDTSEPPTQKTEERPVRPRLDSEKNLLFRKTKERRCVQQRATDTKVPALTGSVFIV